MNFAGRLCSPDSPFSLENSISATLEVGSGAMRLTWRQGEHDLSIKATHRRQLRYIGQLLDGETGLNLGNVAMEPLTSLFDWQIQLIKRGEARPVYYPLYHLLLQPTELAPEGLTIRLSAEHYWLPEQFSLAIENYLKNWTMLWPLYYAACRVDNEITAADILSLAVRRDFSHCGTETIEALWRGREELGQRIAQIPPDALPDHPDIFALFSYILETVPAISLLGASALIARLRPASVPLLNSALQSWYISIEDNEALAEVLHEVSLDLQRNKEALQTLSYEGQPLPPALGWSLALSSMSDYFIH